MIEQDIENSSYFPIQEDILKLIRGVTLNNNGDTFFRALIASNLAQIAGAMRARVTDPFNEETTLNLYVCGTMPSGSGKSQAQSRVLDDITQGFKDVFVRTILPEAHSRQVDIIATEQVMLEIGSVNPAAIEIAKKPIEEEYYSYGNYLWRLSGGTEAAIRQERKRIQLQGCGALNVFVDEIGYNLISNQALNILGLCLYDGGKIEASITKVTKDNSRFPERDIPIPVNFLWMGDPTKLFDSGETEKAFIEFLASGYARRTLFGTGGAKNTSIGLTPQEILNMRRTAYEPQLRDSVMQSISRLANKNYLNMNIHIEDPEMLYLYEYEIWCKQRAEALSDISDSIFKTELSERMYKVLKLAGIYAFIDGSSKVTKDHLRYAMKLAEDSGKALYSMLHTEKPYIKLAKYLSTVKEPKSKADICEALPFFKNTKYQNELLDRAAEWGYNHGITLKTIRKGKLEFYLGECLKDTDLDKLYVSISTQMTTNYENLYFKFDDLAKLGQKDGLHWCVHHFMTNPKEPDSGGYRSSEFAYKPFNLLVLDLDHGDSLEFIQSVLQDYKYVLYTTKSHTPTVPRCRVIIPLKYEVSLDKDEYRKFMENVFEGFPFRGMDEATKDISRKWLTNAGQVIEHVEGDLLDPRQFIPDTAEDAIRQSNMKKYGNADRIQRWFLSKMEQGNRNNMLIRYGYMLKDMGQSGLALEESILSLNNKLETPLSVDEVRHTILKSLTRG